MNAEPPFLSGDAFITNQCPHCSGSYEFPADGVGQLISCPHCGQEFRLAKPLRMELISTAKIALVVLTIGAGLFYGFIQWDHSQKIAARKMAETRVQQEEKARLTREAEQQAQIEAQRIAEIERQKAEAVRAVALKEAEQAKLEQLQHQLEQERLARLESIRQANVKAFKERQRVQNEKTLEYQQRLVEQEKQRQENIRLSVQANLDRRSLLAGGNSNVIESKIDGDFEGWEGETIVKLMNGQIWQQTEYHYYYHYAFMPDVLVYNSGGGWKMKVEGVDKAVRVQKLK